jgi:hypothetical protein
MFYGAHPCLCVTVFSFYSKLLDVGPKTDSNLVKRITNSKV